MASAELTGLEELLDGLAAADKYLETGAKPYHRLAAGELYRRVLPGVPVGPTGKLKGSGRFTGQKRKGVVKFGGKRVPWAPPMHWGWPRRPQGGSNPATEFLYSELPGARPPIVAVYELAAEEGLKRAGLA